MLPHKAEQIAEFVANGGRVAVPAFWRHEILNALLVGEPRKRVSSELVKAFIRDLNRMPVDVEQQATSVVVFTSTHALCRKHGLTAYDPAYFRN